MLQWKNSGKKYDFYWMNLDALSFIADGVTGRINKAPAKRVEIVKNTPEEMVLVVESDGGHPNSGITAAFRYTFSAGTPLIRCQVQLNNPLGKASKVLRLNQFSFSKTNWTNVLLSEPFSSYDFSRKGSYKNHAGKNKYSWSGFCDDNNAFAIISIGTQPKSFVHVYSPESMYCSGYKNYTSDKLVKLDQYIYVGKGGNDEIKKWAEYLSQLN